ncbi:endoplasmic reticulum Oxidoreductin 1-domain-containing protein [Pavlovales sp. CCMP2436]|nr:endoplasmic reticulum Oxidoreductin 1-domain-containing protein [Pavlovales sp. CCMP2436]|mmetsp:Transcript_32400/g.80624  ORF Transcript_32400/g.80624 Transcript_32400/m.80624 type:complete len:556 (-) Transcript_32400:108-1775(-)
MTRALALCAGLVLSAHALTNPWEALPPPFDEDAFCPRGPVGDATCDSEAVERANSEQLHSILKEITDETFFRLWRVDLHGECPFERFADSESASCAPFHEPAAAPFLAHAQHGASFLSPAEDEEEPTGSCSVEMHTEHPELLFDEADATDLVDTTISRAEDEVAPLGASVAPCDDEHMPQFWLDMCSRIPTVSGQVVNLRLNPESDTGYNGSAIWAAMYQENCFVRASQPSSMCLEERVLYRLLSGMHASTNIHVAAHHNASLSLHASGVDIFARHFAGERSERLRDLHFAFVVLLRAVQKGAEFIRDFPYAQGVSAEEGQRTGALVGRLLDSCILQSCASVFSAFDEALLFQKPHEHTWWSLRRQFKGVFHNISHIVDCIPCQKCKLHGKLQLLGLGTALKWLLLPADLIHSTTSREELVALVNTLGKFSRAISWSRQLSAAARHQSRELTEAKRTTPAAVSAGAPVPPAAAQSVPLFDAVGLIADARRLLRISGEQETALLRLALANDPAIARLVRHYGADAARHFPLLVEASGAQPRAAEPAAHAIAVGSTL